MENRIFELIPTDNRKSFYGKAKIIECKEGRYLQSYDTKVCFLSYGGTFKRLWDGYSATTMRHINSFMDYVRWNKFGGKAWWDTLIPGKEYCYSDFNAWYNMYYKIHP